MEPMTSRAESTPKDRLAGPMAIIAIIVIGTAAIAVVVSQLPAQDLAPTPSVSIERTPLRVQNCVVGKECKGLTVRAQDPEGDKVKIQFYDQATGKPVGKPITADSGESVTPEFTFDKAGEQKLYMVVEDGAGHTSQDYPVIIPVQVD
jgi:hypothetical protein